MPTKMPQSLVEGRTAHNTKAVNAVHEFTKEEIEFIAEKDYEYVAACFKAQRDANQAAGKESYEVKMPTKEEYMAYATSEQTINVMNRSRRLYNNAVHVIGQIADMKQELGYAIKEPYSRAEFTAVDQDKTYAETYAEFDLDYNEGKRGFQLVGRRVFEDLKKLSASQLLSTDIEERLGAMEQLSNPVNAISSMTMLDALGYKNTSDSDSVKPDPHGYLPVQYYTTMTDAEGKQVPGRNAYMIKSEKNPDGVFDMEEARMLMENANLMYQCAEFGSSVHDYASPFGWNRGMNPDMVYMVQGQMVEGNYESYVGNVPDISYGMLGGANSVTRYSSEIISNFTLVRGAAGHMSNDPSAVTSTNDAVYKMQVQDERLKKNGWLDWDFSAYHVEDPEGKLGDNWEVDFSAAPDLAGNLPVKGHPDIIAHRMEKSYAMQLLHENFDRKDLKFELNDYGRKMAPEREAARNQLAEYQKQAEAMKARLNELMPNPNNASKEFKELAKAVNEWQQAIADEAARGRYNPSLSKIHNRLETVQNKAEKYLEAKQKNFFHNQLRRDRMDFAGRLLELNDPEMGRKQVAILGESLKKQQDKLDDLLTAVEKGGMPMEQQRAAIEECMTEMVAQRIHMQQLERTGSVMESKDVREMSSAASITETAAGLKNDAKFQEQLKWLDSTEKLRHFASGNDQHSANRAYLNMLVNSPDLETMKVAFQKDQELKETVVGALKEKEQREAEAKMTEGQVRQKVKSGLATLRTRAQNQLAKLVKEHADPEKIADCECRLIAYATVQKAIDADKTLTKEQLRQYVTPEALNANAKDIRNSELYAIAKQEMAKKGPDAMYKDTDQWSVLLGKQNELYNQFVNAAKVQKEKAAQPAPKTEQRTAQNTEQRSRASSVKAENGPAVKS